MDRFRTVIARLAGWVGASRDIVRSPVVAAPSPADVVPIAYAEWDVDHPIRTPVAPLVELLLVVDGAVELTVGARRAVARAGEMALVNAHRGNRGDDGGARHGCVSFDIAGAPRLRALGARPLLLVRRARDPVAMRMRLRDVCQRLERTRGLAGAWRTSAVLALLATAHDDAGATAADADPRVDAALVAIEARLADAALSLGDLAGAAALSPDRLTTLFRQRFGRTPMRQVACMRLARARNLLTRSDLSVKQVAAAVGFRDPLYFSRAFRAAFGQPPTAAR